MGRTYADAMRRNEIYNTNSNKKGRVYGDIWLEPESAKGKAASKKHTDEVVKGLKSASGFFGFGKKK